MRVQVALSDDGDSDGAVPAAPKNRAHVRDGIHWAGVAARVEGRTAKQCMQKWCVTTALRYLMGPLCMLFASSSGQCVQSAQAAVFKPAVW